MYRRFLCTFPRKGELRVGVVDVKRWREEVRVVLTLVGFGFILNEEWLILIAQCRIEELEVLAKRSKVVEWKYGVCNC